MTRQEKTVLLVAGSEVAIIVLLLLWENFSPPAPGSTNLIFPVTIDGVQPIDVTYNIPPNVYDFSYTFPDDAPAQYSLGNPMMGPPCACDTCSDIHIDFPDFSDVTDGLNEILRGLTLNGIGDVYDDLSQNMLWTANAFFSPWTPIPGMAWNYDQQSWGSNSPGYLSSSSAANGNVMTPAQIAAALSLTHGG